MKSGVLVLVVATLARFLFLLVGALHCMRKRRKEHLIRTQLPRLESCLVVLLLNEITDI
jgi:hypothetical protein